MISKRKLGVARGLSDPAARLPLWFHVSSLLLCAVAVAVPLVVSDNMLGLLSISKTEPRAFALRTFPPGKISGRPRHSRHP